MTVASCGGETGGFALVVSAAGANDNGYNEYAIEGLRKAGEEFDVNTKVVDDTTDIPGTLAELADAGYETIFSLEYNFDALITNDGSGKSIAEQYPETNFVVFNAFANTATDGSKIHDNVTEVLFNVNEASFVAGALSVYLNEEASTLLGSAYSFTDTSDARESCFMGGAASSGITVFGHGYVQGVNYAAKDLGVTYGYTENLNSGFASSPESRTIADNMFASGCNVVFGAAGGVATDIRNAAAASKKLMIDVDANQDSTVPGSVLTSVLKRTDVITYDIVKKTVNGQEAEFRGKDLEYDLSSGSVSITDLSVISGYIEPSAAQTWESIKGKLTEIENDIKDGTITVVNPQSGETLDFGTLTNIVKRA